MLPALICLAAVMAGCSERSDNATNPVAEGVVTEIVISDFMFSGRAITIDRGTTVRWRNSTATFHTVTPDGHQAFAARQTNSQGEVFETTFDTPGTYRYYCAPHRGLGMTGEIIVR
jgi:plastocyanin